MQRAGADPTRRRPALAGRGRLFEAEFLVYGLSAFEFSRILERGNLQVEATTYHFQTGSHILEGINRSLTEGLIFSQNHRC